MNHSFRFVTWWPVAELTTASSGSSQISAPLSSCVKYSPLCWLRYRPIKTAIITSNKNNIARITVKRIWKKFKVSLFPLMRKRIYLYLGNVNVCSVAILNYWNYQMTIWLKNDLAKHSIQFWIWLYLKYHVVKRELQNF